MRLLDDSFTADSPQCIFAILQVLIPVEMPGRGLGAVAADLRVPNGDLLPAVVAIGHMVIAGPALLPLPK